MSAGGEPAILARGGVSHLEEVRGVLRAGGIESELVQPPEGCGSS